MDILERITAYDCSDGGHCDAAEGSAYDLMADAAEEIKFLRTQSVVPDGWQLVPKEPTPDMRIAGGIAWAEALPSSETYVDTADACYKAMLAASPSPGSPVAGEGK